MAKRSMRKKQAVSNQTTTNESQESLETRESFESFRKVLYAILRLKSALDALPWSDADSDRKTTEDAISDLICTVDTHRDYHESMLIEAGGYPTPCCAGADLSLTTSHSTPSSCALIPIRVGDRIHVWRHDSESEGVVVEVASRGVFVKADDDGEVFAVPWCEVSALSTECAVMTP